MGNWCILLHQLFRTFRKQEITLPKTFFFYGNYAVFSPSSIFDDAERPRGVYKYISAINMLGIRSAFWCRMLVVISPLTSSEVPAFQNSLRLPSCTWQTPCVCLLYDLVSLSSARPSDDTLRHYDVVSAFYYEENSIMKEPLGLKLCADWMTNGRWLWRKSN